MDYFDEVNGYGSGHAYLTHEEYLGVGPRADEYAVIEFYSKQFNEIDYDAAKELPNHRLEDGSWWQFNVQVCNPEHGIANVDVMVSITDPDHAHYHPDDPQNVDEIHEQFSFAVGNRNGVERINQFLSDHKIELNYDQIANHMQKMIPELSSSQLEFGV